ncbi:hypothetical protein NPIL_126171 [Nephila pilipes]|uniref:Uncharacterized protein n=1 Tax=Nephila pilipes TaxID=299642 RepID=A0A8X6UHD4_NEPPI|nr:hypothetical protein NPIL_543841 [Nephila pilipes]GFU17663.1 hypothetical protein NPIL_126171 [Nephila pilipes]
MKSRITCGPVSLAFNFIDKNAFGSHLSSHNYTNELPIATSDASVQTLKGAPGMGYFRRVATARAFLASVNAFSASSDH